MKLSSNTCLFFYLLILLAGCTKNDFDDEEDKQEVTDSFMPVIWYVPLLPDTLHAHGMTPFMYNNLVITGGEKVWGSEPWQLRVFDKLTGEQVFSYTIGIGFDCQTMPQDEMHIVQLNNKLVFCCSDAVMCFNLDSYSFDWITNSNGNSSITNFGETIFQTRDDGSYPTLKSTLMKTNINTGIWDSVFSVEKEDIYDESLFHPALQIDETGDSILVFQSRGWAWDTTGVGGRVNLYCYNMSKDSLLWKINNIEPNGIGSTLNPLIVNSKVYFPSYRTLYCLSLQTGELLWSRSFEKFGEYFRGCNIKYYLNQLIVKPSGDYIYSISPEDGSIIWETEDNAGNPSELEFYDEKIYYTSSNLYCVNAVSGKLNWAEPHPEYIEGNYLSDSQFHESVAIDSINSLIFVSDNWFFYCYSLP